MNLQWITSLGMSMGTFVLHHWIITLITLIILGIIIRTKIRGFFWLDVEGNELSLKEFLGRWRKGVDGITPVQNSRMQIMGTWIVITGVIAGIVINALTRMKNQWWWIEVVLIGSLIITSMQMIGLWQKYKSQKKAEDAYKEAMSQMEETNEKKI